MAYNSTRRAFSPSMAASCCAIFSISPARSTPPAPPEKSERGMEAFKPLIAKVATGAALTRAEAVSAFDAMLSGEVTPAQMGGFLMALRTRGESVEEITGAVEAM